MHEYLPHVKYDTGAGVPVKIILPSQLLSAKFEIRPRSVREKRLLQQAIVANSIKPAVTSPTSHKFEGVTIFSNRLSHLKDETTSTDSLEPSHNRNSITQQMNTTHQQLAKSLPTYTTSHSQPDSMNKENMSPRRLLSRSQTKRSTIISLKGKGAMKNINNNSNNKKMKNLIKTYNSGKNQSVSIASQLDSKSPFDTSSKITKVYYSQRQSVPTDDNMAVAPPSTPGPELMKKYDYVPCMSDALAKQQVKSKLKIMKKEELEKEKIKNAEKMKLDLKNQKEREVDLKRQQRRLIYMLNAEMTAVENRQFENFKSIHGLKPKQYPEP